MVFEISNLRKIRKQLNLTQHEFARIAGISQSMVAKIEAEKLDPTYSFVKKIEAAIDSISNHHEKEAKDIMNKRVIAVERSERVKNIIKTLTGHDISQVPVVDRDNVVGMITESILLEKGIDINKLAEEIMAESPPIISKDAKMSVVLQLLKFYPIVIVKESGKMVGVITKADVLKNLR